MSYERTFAISAAGMSVERMRIEAAAVNLANANTVQAPDGTAFQPIRVVARTMTGVPGGASFTAQVDDGLGEAGPAQLPFPVAEIEAADATPRRVYEPGHPLADAKGLVSYPGVDAATEMVGLMTALRSYEANVAAMNVARSLAQKTLEIGGGT